MSSLTDRLQNLSDRLRDSGRYTADSADIVDASLVDEAVAGLLALDYVLPFVHLDIRDKALQIARGEDQPGPST
jgi:hypothetical protein